MKTLLSSFVPAASSRRARTVLPFCTLLCAAQLLLPATGSAQVTGLGLSWSNLVSFSGTVTPASQIRSLRSLALSKDETNIYGGFTAGSSSAGIRQVSTVNGAILTTNVVGNSRVMKGGATDDRGYVYFSTALPSTDGQFRIYDSALNQINSVLLGGTQNVGGLTLKKLGTNYYVYIAREGNSTIERYDVTNPGDPISLDLTFGTAGKLSLNAHLGGNFNLTGLTVDDDGTIYQTVRDAAGGTVVKISPDLATITTRALTRAMDVAVYRNRIYVTEYNGSSSVVAVLRKSDLTILTTLPTGIARANASDSGYSGIEVTAGGRLYVADQVINSPVTAVVQDRILVSSVLPDEPEISDTTDDQSLVAGGNFTVAVAATGTGPLFYQWRRNSTVLVGETNSSVTVNAALTNHTGFYFAVVSNIAGVVTSEFAHVSVQAPPVVVGGPDSLVRTQHQSAFFQVVVEGTAPFRYQWYFANALLPDATNSFISIGSVTPANEGEYYAVVSNTVASVTSSVATLTVLVPPTIVTNPLSAIVPTGSNVTFEVAATGTAPLHYQWFFANAPLLNETNTTLTKSSLIYADHGQYFAVVTNLAGSATSTFASLTVVTDLVPPSVKITTPKASKIYPASLVINGTAKDDVFMAGVQYSLNGAAFTPATVIGGGTQSNWNASVNLVPGTNTLLVKSFDGYLYSPVAKVTFFYNVTSTLTLNVNGPGSAVGTVSSIGTPANGASLLVGRGYKIIGFPSPNAILANWTNAAGTVLQTNNNTLVFVMQSNLVINANFLTNPFAPVSGVYNGLFHETGAVTHASAGFVTFKVTPKLTYSGKLTVAGDSVSFSGKFRVDGGANATVSRVKKGKPDLDLAFMLDFYNGATGTVAGPGWTANLTADRKVWSKDLGSELYADAFTNRYTLALDGFTNTTEGPVGYTYGVITVDRLGKVKLTGALADGHKFKQTTYVSANGQWPLYAPLYVTKDQVVTIGDTTKTNKEYQGSAFGWLNFAPNAEAGTTNLAPQGDLSWIKTHWTNTYFPGGFTNQGTVYSSRHLAPLIKTERAYNFTNGTITVSEGDLGGPFANDIFLKTNNTFVVTLGAPSFKASFTAKTGVIKGEFLHSIGGLKTKWTGVLLDDLNFGAGMFLGPTNGGKIHLDVEPLDAQ